MMKHINFIPKELRAKVVIPYATAPLVLFIAFFLYGSITVVTTKLSIHRNEKELAQLNQENVALTEKIQRLSDRNRRFEKNNEELNTLQKVLSRKNYWSEIFKELSILIPEGVWVTSFINSKAGENATNTDLLVLKGEATAQSTMASFLSVLEGSQHFAGAQISSSEKKNLVSPPLYAFEFSIPIKTAVAGDQP